MTAMTERPDELALVERFRRGDDAAFDRIVTQHAAEIAALANRLLAWPQDVDDVVQEVFISALQGLEKFRGQCQLRTWLFTITVNKCRSYRRRASRNGKLMDTEPQIETHANAETKAMTAEAFAQVQRAVQALPTKYREVVVLRYLEGLETAEICELLGIKANTMQVRLNRARKQLRESLTHLTQEKP